VARVFCAIEGQNMGVEAESAGRAAGIVVIGGGHAGVQLCNGLAAAGLGQRVHLVCAEPVLPYQRPPLSKAFLKGPDESLQWHRPAEWFAEAGIQVNTGDAAVDIDRAARRVTLASGRVLDYERLVLATGARPRSLPNLPAGLDNVAELRSAADAQRLRDRLAAAKSVTIVGGGFIGLEVAASARARGLAVQVLESAPRLLMRSVSPELSEHVLRTHLASGIELRLGVAVGGFVVDGQPGAQRLLSLEVTGLAQPVDLRVRGIGAAPEHALASAAGLDCENGIVVDEFMQTSDPAVLAVGDCTSFPEARSGRRLRLESVQNANDQARTAVQTLTGAPQPYRALPWFWSEQGSMRLQMAGLTPADGERHLRPGSTPASFSVLHYAGGVLACVESVNAPMDHIAARKLLEAGISPAPAEACDPARALKSFGGCAAPGAPAVLAAVPSLPSLPSLPAASSGRQHRAGCCRLK
jgi:3-phenylpropionate/trans-cinnamate dioxygenase ferredoxin reductase subunit